MKAPLVAGVEERRRGQKAERVCRDNCSGESSCEEQQRNEGGARGKQDTGSRTEGLAFVLNGYEDILKGISSRTKAIDDVKKRTKIAGENSLRRYRGWCLGCK